MQSPDARNHKYAALALCLAIVGAASILYFHLRLFLPNMLEARTEHGLGNGYAFGDDFYPLWLVARQWNIQHRNPYSPEMTREIQAGLFGRALDAHNPSDPPVRYREFSYPAFTELLVWPAASFEFPTLRLILAILLPLLTTASLWLWTLAMRWRVHSLWFAVLALLALCNYPVLEALFAEQPGLLVSFLLASASLAITRKKLLLAGSLLSLTLIKPQMTLAAIAFLLLWSLSDRSRARLWVGFLGTLILLVATSLCIWPQWIAQWMSIMRGYHRYATPALVTLLPGATLGVYIGPAAIVVLLGAGALLGWRNRHANPDSSNFWLTLSLLLAITSVTLLPGQAIYDHVILFPGIILLLRYWRALYDGGRIPRMLLVIGAIVLSWQWAAALAVIVVHPWIAHGSFESAALDLPIRTAASLPFAVLALLFYVRRLNVTVNDFPVNQEAF